MNQAFSFPVVDIDAHPPFAPLPVDYIGELDMETFFARLSLAGIAVACGKLLPSTGFFESHGCEESVALLNAAALNLAKSNPRYLPSLWIHPDCPDFSIAQLEEYSAAGVRLFEIDAEWLSRPGLTPILSAAHSLGLTAVLHGEKIAQADELAAQFPSLRMLVGGLGSIGYMPAAAHTLLMKHANLSLNLSAAIWGGNYVLHEWTDRLGAERLCFGSGYPFSNPAGKLSALRWELRDQPDSVRELILSKNVLRLVGAKGGLSWK